MDQVTVDCVLERWQATDTCEKLAEDAAQTTLMVVEFKRWCREQARAFAAH